MLCLDLHDFFGRRISNAGVGGAHVQLAPQDVVVRLQPSMRSVFLATGYRGHNRNLCPSRNSSGKSTGVTYVFVAHEDIHVPSSFARFG